MQTSLAERVVYERIKPRYVAGADVAYTERASIGAVSVLDYKTLATVEVKTAVTKIFFPYVPTLLSLREIPPLVKAANAIGRKPDVYFVDGHGMLHPYRCGLATHFGVVLNVASIGVAKNRLVGEVGSFDQRDWAPVRIGDRVLGAALRVPGRDKLMFISVGNKVILRQAISIVRHCNLGYIMPEPIRVAHVEANKVRERILRRAGDDQT